MFLKIALLIIFFAVMIAVGLIARRQATDVNGFVLGGRSVGPWLTAFAYGTSYFSAVVFIGYAGQFGWKYGLSSTWVGLGNAFIGSLLAWAIMGRRTRVMTHHLDAKTMPEFFGKRYESKSLRISASAIAFVFLIPYTASVYKGLSTLFGLAFNIDYRWCVIAMAILTAVYVILGGYMATAINDFIQGIIMLAGICAVIVAVLKGQGGFLAAIQKLSQIPVDTQNTTAALQNMTGPFVSFFGPDPINLLGVVILTSLGTWGLPQMVGKFYAIKSEKAVKTGTIVSTFFAVIISGGCYFLGGFGRIYEEFQGECMLFPSKEQRDWSKFNVPNYKKAKFDPKTLKPFDKVLVRYDNGDCWCCALFSNIINGEGIYKYQCVSSAFKCCIPYNEDTENLIGTTNEAPEFYKYWED